MNRLLEIKEWATIPQAAKYLSDSLKEEVTEADVLQFALSGKITLSVVLSGTESGAICKITSPRINYIPFEENDELGIIKRELIRNHHVLETYIETILCLKGTFDLTMYGGEFSFVFDYFKNLDKETEADWFISSTSDGSPAVLEKGDKLYALYSKFKPTEPWMDTQYNSHSLPSDSQLVIRTSILKKFAQFLCENNTPSKKNTNQAEIDNQKAVNSLRKMIIAMAIDCYGYDPRKKKNSATKDITAAIERVNLTLGDDAVRNHLKMAAELLETQTLKDLYPE